MAKHCATLEVLQVTNILEDSSSTLRQILSSSPKLRILITSVDKLHVQSWILYLEAKDFVDEQMLSGDQNPWACDSSLRVLKTKTPVFQGRMSRSFSMDEEDYQYECLEMILESGMGQLTCKCYQHHLICTGSLNMLEHVHIEVFELQTHRFLTSRPSFRTITASETHKK